MAKFGQSFIQSLTQPGYGMFELGSTLGQAPAKAAEKRKRAGMLEDIKDMTPLETADYAVGKAETPDQLIAAKTARDAALKTSGVQSIDVMQQQLLTETDPVRMQELENAMVAVGKQTGNDVSKYSGLAGKTLAARDTAAWEQSQRQSLAHNPVATPLTPDPDRIPTAPDCNHGVQVHSAAIQAHSDRGCAAPPPELAKQPICWPGAPPFRRMRGPPRWKQHPAATAVRPQVNQDCG